MSSKSSASRGAGLYSGNLPPSSIDALCAVLGRDQIVEIFGWDDEDLDAFYTASDPRAVRQIRKLRQAIVAVVRNIEKRNAAYAANVGKKTR